MNYKFTVFLFVCSALNNLAMDDVYSDKVSQDNKLFLVSALFNNRLCQHVNEYSLVGFSSTGKYIAAASNDAITIWNLSTKEKLHTLTVDTLKPSFARFSDDDTQLAARYDDGTVHVWDVAIGDCKYSLKNKNYISFLTYSSNSAQMATASLSGSIRIWDASNGESLRSIYAHPRGVCFLQYHDNDARLASNGLHEAINSLKIWDVQTGEHLFTVIGGKDPVVVSYLNGISMLPLMRFKSQSHCDIKEFLAQFGIIDSAEIFGFSYPHLTHLLISTNHEIKILNMDTAKKFLVKNLKAFTPDEKALMLKFASHQALDTKEQQTLIEMGFNIDYEL